MENVKNIVFDLGGVIMDIDVHRTIHAFRNLGLENIADYFGHGFAASFVSDHEVGKISDELFFTNIRQLLLRDLPDEQLTNAWNALLLSFPADRIALLKQLKSRYRLFLFSNTNAIHYRKFREMYRKEYDGELDDLFEKAYYSHILGHRKPEIEGFLQILNENSLNPAETLFVDDALINVEGAVKAGIRGLYLPPGFFITDITW